MQLVLATRGLTIEKRNNSFCLKTEAHERIISPVKITSIMVASFCSLQSSAILLAAAHQIPIYFIDESGSIKARLGDASFGNLTELRRKQAVFNVSHEAMKWSIDLFMLKAEGQIANLKLLLRRCSNQRVILEKTIKEIENENEKLASLHENPDNTNFDALRGRESNIARYYWQGLSACMEGYWAFGSRSRQPAADPFNACLNYLYGMLYTEVETATFSAGLDAYLGIMHADQYAKPVLSYDIIEPFRPWIDALIIEKCLDREMESTFFENKNQGVWISKKGKQYLIPLFYQFINEKAKFRNEITSRKNHIYRMAGELRELILPKNKASIAEITDVEF